MQIFGHLLVDIGVLGALMYMASGTTSPFALLYLPLLVVGAATLRGPLLNLLVLVCVASYAFLMAFHHESTADDVFNIQHALLEFAMWLALSMVAVFVAVFVSRLSRVAREQQRREQIASEKTHRDEALISLAALAAGTAHELNTPLSTMAVITDEMQQAGQPGADYEENVAALRSQIEACRHALKDMVVAASADYFEGARECSALNFLEESLDRFRFLRPSVELRFSYEKLDEEDLLIADKTLRHALINLINNAADASSEPVEVIATTEDGRLFVDIRDRGPGVPRAVREQIGHPFFTTKGRSVGGGKGIGLFITNRTIESFVGSVTMYERAGGGTCVCVTLPLLTRNKTGGVHGRSIGSAIADAPARLVGG
jgi:two-component system sensor histidine kinase RegB